MNEQQKKFCEEYVKCYNATKAYSIAYPDANYNTCRKNSSMLLKHEELREYIQKLQADAVKAFGDAAALMAKELLEDIVYRDEDGNKSPGWQKSVDLLSKNLGLQKQDISVKTTTITVDIDE